jgi:hypothetical protein
MSSVYTFVSSAYVFVLKQARKLEIGNHLLFVAQCSCIYGAGHWCPYYTKMIRKTSDVARKTRLKPVKKLEGLIPNVFTI